MKILRIAAAVLAVAALIVHAMMKHSLAGSGAAAALLAPNPSVPLGSLLQVGFFVLLRVFVIVILPGLVLAAAAAWLVNRRESQGAP